ncbi:HlyD family type I secretion periplasmic adaptor subunit [Pelodictyon luteolum]|uniref:Type I secretion membrane fusion protein, HlyD n=1 Tax=Chlorobium luteolum (strain DSM 273 / BCRC 81028 / 2530) TaxID=319225 RepID=Q3B5W0_CHLL3|nr:HlyD family type I secretion periplasmic adaptor subunit [Pelodictyon luteolum]ABB23271.1 Type I secretion membrane fusion protein, HlyD [Pelodictyon luteolum DSM 273]
MKFPFLKGRSAEEILAGFLSPHSEGEEASRFARFVSSSLERIDRLNRLWGGKQSTPTFLLLSITVFLAVMLIWASFAELDHVVTGQGKVVTPKQTQLIQSLEGGIIEHIYAREGDVAEEGSVLVSLDPTQAKSLYGQAQKEERAIAVRVERLLAEKEERDPVFPFELMQEEPELIAAEQAQYRERKAVLDTEFQLLDAQVSQRREERMQAEAELHRATRELELARAEYGLIKDLVDRRLEARLSLINVDRERNEALSQLNKAKVSLKRADAALAEGRFRLAQSRMNFMSQVGNEYAEGVGRLAEVRQKLQGLSDRLNRTQLVAPVNAIVNKIHVRTEGGVVQPGQPILELTPIDGKIEIEAAIQQKDIAFVHIGQTVSVKLTAYDFSRFGDIKGKVTVISPDAQQLEDGREFFQVRVELDQSYLENKGRHYPVTPGMAANVDMVIAKRTVMEYLMEPVFKLQDRAFRE